VRRQSAALARLEVHDVIADPRHVALLVMLEYALAALAQLCERHAERRVGRLRAGDRLEEKIDGRAAPQGRELRADVCQAAGLRGDAERRDQSVQAMKDA